MCIIGYTMTGLCFWSGAGSYITPVVRRFTDLVKKSSENSKRYVYLRHGSTVLLLASPSSVRVSPGHPLMIHNCFMNESIELTKIGRQVFRKQLKNSVSDIGAMPSLDTVVSSDISTPHSLVPQSITSWLSLFLAGWNAGSTGPLLSGIQQVYPGVSSRLHGSSLDFRASACGEFEMPFLCILPL